MQSSINPKKSAAVIIITRKHMYRSINLKKSAAVIIITRKHMYRRGNFEERGKEAVYAYPNRRFRPLRTF